MNGHGAGHHGHSHSRKSHTERSPLQPTSFNGGNSVNQANGGTTITNLLKPQMSPQHQSQKSASIYYDTQQEQAVPFPQLSSPHPSFSDASYARSKSMERRKSVGLPTHLRLQGNGFGVPTPTAQRFRSNTIEPGMSIPWITSAEVISSILIPLPYVAASMLYALNISKIPVTATNSLKTLQNLNTPLYGLPFVCFLTSMTLLFVGTVGYMGAMGHGHTNLDRRKSSLGSEGQETARTTYIAQAAYRIIGRVLTVGLPFYATSKIGAARVALIMLVGLSSKIIAVEDEATDLTKAKTWKLLWTHRRWAVGSIVLQLVCDSTGLTNDVTIANVSLGYLALGLSVFVISPSFPSLRFKVSGDTSTTPPTARSKSWTGQVESKLANPSRISSMICTPEDTKLTLWSGVILAMFSVAALTVWNPSNSHSLLSQLRWSFPGSFFAAMALTSSDPKSLRNSKGLGLVIGSLSSSFIMAFLAADPWTLFAYQSVLTGLSFTATRLDASATLSSSSRSKHHHHRQDVHGADHVQMSRISEFVLRNAPKSQLLHSILTEKDSRRILYFMCLNFAFMLVQTFYGLATGSLGLLSDSIHMFFDCIALVVGLCAAVMSKWPPSTRFPYGYGKMDTLAGFANGIFLMLISLEIVYEATERLVEGSRVNKLGELLTVSTLGLIVNLVGLTAFGHAHHGHSHGGHSHGDHSHAEHDHAGHSFPDHNHNNETSQHDHSHHDHSHHDHSHHDHSHEISPQKHHHTPPSAHAHLDHLHDHSAGLSPSPSIYSVPTTPSKPVHPHSHSHGHASHGHAHHDHGNENMHGIFLHVMADTLGSVAVVISTILIHFYGWSGFDPLASCFIAIAIFASAIPLVTSSARTLLLTVPADTEYDLREALAGLSGLRGVAGYAVPKFWLEGGEGKVLGVVHVVAGKLADMEDVKERSIAFLKGRNMDVVVQVEREGNGRCWCQAQQ